MPAMIASATQLAAHLLARFLAGFFTGSVDVRCADGERLSANGSAVPLPTILRVPGLPSRLWLLSDGGSIGSWAALAFFQRLLPQEADWPA